MFNSQHSQLKQYVLMAALVLLSSILNPQSSIAQTPGTPTYPTTLDTQRTLLDISNNAATNMNGGVNSGATTFNVADTSAFASTGAFTVDGEIVLYTGKNSNQFTGCVRGAFGSTAASHTNGAAVRQNILAQHFTARGTAIIAVETKIGTGSSTPVADTVLQGTGTGTSAWNSLATTPSVDFTIGKNTAKAGNTFRFLVSSDGNKPGLRYNGTLWEFSNDGTNWSGLGSGGGVAGSGQTGQFAYWSNSVTLAAAPLTLSGTTVSASNKARVLEQFGVGLNGTPSSTIGINNQHTFSGDGTGIFNYTEIAAGAGTFAGAMGIQSDVQNISVGNSSGEFVGGELRATHGGTGSANDVIGARGYARNTSNSATARMIGVESCGIL